MISAIVLAAGASTRMGQAKAALPLGQTGETVLSRVVRTLLDRVGTNLGFLIQDLGAGQTIDQAILRFGITYPEFQDEVIRRLGFRMRQSQ